MGARTSGAALKAQGGIALEVADGVALEVAGVVPSHSVKVAAPSRRVYPQARAKTSRTTA